MDTDLEPLVPRDLVPHALHTTINAILKDLKICSRQIHHALDSHADEAQLLNRIYYKNKNQHRGALFWRRLVEMRRYSERLDKAIILSTLDGIRTSFFGPEAKQKYALYVCNATIRQLWFRKSETFKRTMDPFTPKETCGEGP